MSQREHGSVGGQGNVDQPMRRDIMTPVIVGIGIVAVIVLLWAVVAAM